MVSQNLGIFHNKDDKLVDEVTQELEHFKQVFFGLIDKAQGKLNQLEAKRKLVHKDDDLQIKLMDIEYELISDLVKIYKELVNLPHIVKLYDKRTNSKIFILKMVEFSIIFICTVEGGGRCGRYYYTTILLFIYFIVHSCNLCYFLLFLF
jgi:hypothetical protein